MRTQSRRFKLILLGLLALALIAGLAFKTGGHSEPLPTTPEPVNVGEPANPPKSAPVEPSLPPESLELAEAPAEPGSPPKPGREAPVVKAPDNLRHSGSDHHTPGIDDPPDREPPNSPPPPVFIPPKQEPQPEPEPRVAESNHNDPAACRKTHTPATNTNWVKVANFEWAEPNHTPGVISSPGYWQPALLKSAGNRPIVSWNSYTDRRKDGTTLRDKEAKFYKITRLPHGWADGSGVINAAGGFVSGELFTFLSRTGGGDMTNSGIRIDSPWVYEFVDYQSIGGHHGYFYHIQASTCPAGPWSNPLKLQWNYPNPPVINEHASFLTPYASTADRKKDLERDGLNNDGDPSNDQHSGDDIDNGVCEDKTPWERCYVLPDGRMALHLDWDFQRGDFYIIQISLIRPPGRFAVCSLDFVYVNHLDLPGAGGSKRIVLESTEAENAKCWNRLQTREGLYLEVTMRVASGTQGLTGNSSDESKHFEIYF